MANNNPQKPIPITVARAQFQQKVAELVNTAGLPAFIMADVFRDMVRTLDQFAEQQYQQELAAYQAEQEKEQEPEEKEA